MSGRANTSPRRRLTTLGVATLLVAAGMVVGVTTTEPVSAAAAPASETPARVQKTATAPTSGPTSGPTYSYPEAIREGVWVEAPFDSDGDGERDRLVADVIRPREAAESGTEVPVVMDASPYYECCGRGNESEKKGYAADGTPTTFPLHYDNYFVPRGYGYVAFDTAGTARSLGCSDVGGKAEILGAKAVIDWLNGRARGFDAAGEPVVAGWTDGKVGMIGKSWDGTVANGVAATGVDGLETIVPIGAISSWYDYSRYDGLLRTPGHHPGLADYVTGRPEQACAEEFAELEEGSADATGDYNDYWAERDYRPDAAKVRASVFAVHGLNDLNVTTRQFGRWWEELAEAGVPRKAWLARTGHVDPFDFRREEWVSTLHRWFDHWLKGRPNGVQDEAQVSIQRADGGWQQEEGWPAKDAEVTAAYLDANDDGTGRLVGDREPRAGTQTVMDRPDLTEAEAASEPGTVKEGRLAFATGALEKDLRLSGRATARLRIRVDQPTTGLAVRLVDYGSANRVDHLSEGEGIHNRQTESCWGAESRTDDACYLDTELDFAERPVEVLTRGWKDAAHHRRLTETTPLKPGRWYTIEVPFQDLDAVMATGHSLGFVFSLSDTEFSAPSATGANLEFDLARSRLELPIVGGGFPETGATAKSTERAALPDRRLDFRRPEFR